MRYTRRRRNRKRSKRGGMFMFRQPAPSPAPSQAGSLENEKQIKLEALRGLTPNVVKASPAALKQRKILEKQIEQIEKNQREMKAVADAQLRDVDAVGDVLAQTSAYTRNQDMDDIEAELAKMEKEEEERTKIQNQINLLEINKTEFRDYFAPIMERIKSYSPEDKMNYLAKEFKEKWTEYKQVLEDIKKLKAVLVTLSGGKKNKTRKVRRKKRKTCKKGKKCKKNRRRSTRRKH